MRFVVTGANGLVGSRLVGELLSAGHEGGAWGRGPQRAPLTPRSASPSPQGRGDVKYVSVDLTDAQAVATAARATMPQVFINPAAMTDVDGCERDPSGAWAATAEAPAALARAARELGSFMLHVSTDYVFDGDAGPYDVDATPNPRGVYAISKFAGELAVKALLPASTWAIARTAVVYGWPSTGKNNFGTWLLSSFAAGKSVNLFSDQWVSTSHATNVAAMLAEIAARRLPGLWHTCGAEVTDRVEFGKRLCARFGFDPALIKPSRMADVRLPSPRPAKSGLIVTQSTNTLEATPWTVAQALEQLHAEYKGES